MTIALESATGDGTKLALPPGRRCYGVSLEMALRAKLTWLSVVFVLSQSTAALAKPDAAKQFDEGLAHYRRHEYSEAAEAFFKAYKASPTADALYNAGLAWELAGDAADAATAYELAGALDLPPKALEDTRTRLARLAPGLQRVEVSAPAGAKVHSDPFVIEAAKAVIYFYPGRHQFSVSLPSGRRVEKTVNAEAGKTAVVLVESSSSSDEDTPEEEPVKSDQTAKPKGESSTPWSTIGWVSVGTAAAAALGAVYFGVETLHERDAFNNSEHRDAAARDRAESNMHRANICWVTAVIAGAGGAGILLFAPGEGRNGAAFSPRLVVRGSF